MAEPTTHRDTNSMISIIALVVAVIALILGWVAYNRSGTDLTTVLDRQVEEVEQDVDLAAARAEAYAELAALEIAQETQATWAVTADEVAEIRADLQTAYANASVEARQEWMELDNEFEMLENQLRAESAESIQTSQNLLELLQRDVATD